MILGLKKPYSFDHLFFCAFVIYQCTGFLRFPGIYVPSFRTTRPQINSPFWLKRYKIVILDLFQMWISKFVDKKSANNEGHLYWHDKKNFSNQTSNCISRMMKVLYTRISRPTYNLRSNFSVQNHKFCKLQIKKQKNSQHQKNT